MPETETPASSYDAVPYESNAFQDAHPDRLAVIATLFGLKPPRIERCRVLELGCASGGNLIPMALEIPDARLVGIDLSRRQIDDGRAIVEAMGLTNVELRAMSLADLDEDLGTFDYIISHGVYSWVPRKVQDRLLEINKRLLAADGAAFISYNTLPGWHARGMVREMMDYHVRSIDDPIARAREGRTFLDSLTNSIPEPGLHALMLRQEAERVRTSTDAYILHEYLEAENRPLYVHEFLAHVERHGLQFLGDARFRTLAENQPPPVKATLERLSPDPLRQEQYLDFLRNRTFRRTLLCHADRQLTRPASPEALRSLRVSTLVVPTPTNPNAPPPAAEEFRYLDRGAVALSTGEPLVRATLRVLFENWPRSVPFAELARLVVARVGDAKELGPMVLQAYVAGLVDLHAYEPPFSTFISEHPEASPLARRQASESKRVTNLRHCLVELSDFDRLVLRQLDGKRDFYAILDALDEATTAGEFTIHQDGQPLKDNLRVRQILGKSLEPSLQRLSSCALLVG